MLDVTKTFDIDDSVKNIDFSKCCSTESLLLAKLWNGDSDIMDLLQQRVSVSKREKNFFATLSKAAFSALICLQ